MGRTRKTQPWPMGVLHSRAEVTSPSMTTFLQAAAWPTAADRASTTIARPFAMVRRFGIVFIPLVFSILLFSPSTPVLEANWPGINYAMMERSRNAIAQQRPPAADLADQGHASALASR